MSTLRDQLLKAGLVDKKQVHKAEKQSRKQRRAPAAAVNAEQQAARQAQAAKAARDQELNRRNVAKAEARARAAQARQLIEQNRLPESDSETWYAFQDGTHVKRIRVDDEQRRQLSRGELEIARLGKSFALLPTAAAERVRERDPQAIVERQIAADSTPHDEDDPYKGFEVPDDLVW